MWVIEFEWDGYEAPTIKGCFELCENPDILNYEKYRFIKNTYQNEGLMYLVAENIISAMNELVGLAYNEGRIDGYGEGLEEGELLG